MEDIVSPRVAVGGGSFDVPLAAEELTWDVHTLGAVKEFLKTAVVIDNEPFVVQPKSVKMVAPVTDFDMGLDAALPALEYPVAEELELSNGLDIRTISDDFASRGIACAFVLPEDDDADSDAKMRRAVAAAKVSDLVIIDWYLKRQDASLTLKILKEIAESDSAENGRLRLICVYTGEPLSDSIYRDVKSYLASGGLPLEDLPGTAYSAAGPSTLVILKNKSEVSAGQLPEILIKSFCRFANGVVPAFSLAAVGAIRKSAHHMLTRFGDWLDTAYIANFILTDPRTDVSELLRELFVAECDAALGLESVADRYLDRPAISAWLQENGERVVAQENGKLPIDLALIKRLLQGRTRDGKFYCGDDELKIKDESRHLISRALAGSHDLSKLAEHEFARLVVMKRESDGRSKLSGSEQWRPSLTTGTILKYELPTRGEEGVEEVDRHEYLVCLSPACDTLRLDVSTPFVFLRAEIEAKKYGIVIREEGGRETFLRLDSKKPVIRTFSFAPDAQLQRVVAVHTDKYRFRFISSEAQNFEWLGEVRYTRAVSEMAKLVQNWMRIGIGDSEYLRLAGRDKIPI